MKKSYADCSQCIAVDFDRVVFKSNTENMSEIDYLFIVNNPDDTLELDKILPNDKYQYVITSAHLCQCPVEVSLDVAKHCYPNLEYIVKKTQPKRIFVIGEIALQFQERISMCHKCQMHTFSGLDEFLDTFKKKPEQKNEEPEQAVTTQSGPYRFHIEEKYYSPEYRLVDIQYVTRRNQLVFIFRDSKNKKIFYEPPMRDTNYYWYESAGTSRYIENISDLKLCQGSFKDRNRTPNCYESDIKIDVKHAVDYYLQSKDEPPILKKNVLYLDIEVYTFFDEIFPSPAQAKYPINAISFRLDEAPTETYIYSMSSEVDKRINTPEFKERFPRVTLFTDEQQMILKLLERIETEFQPDIIAGWNMIGFDMPYIVNRMKKLHIPMNKLSPYNNVYVDDKHRTCLVTGYIVYDQMDLYKGLTYSEEPSYSLDAIAEKVTGKGKVKYDGSLYALYREDIFTFTDYSITDVDRLYEIEDKKQHISTQDELRRFSTTTHHGAATTTGQTDGLTLTLLRKQGQTFRIAIPGQKEEIPGGFVFEPNGGMHKGLLCDFDFTSLYPSIINSFNIGPNTLLGRIDANLAYRYLHDRENLENEEDKNYRWEPAKGCSANGPNTLISRLTNTISYSQLKTLIEENDATVNISGCLYRGHKTELSVFYQIISQLFNSRKEFKSKMLDAKEAGDKGTEVIFDCKQLAVKIMMNSLYGVLANPYFRFYDPKLAKSVTLSGQELLKWSTVHADAFMCEKEVDLSNFIQDVQHDLKYVIYGDTDSLFIDLTKYLKKKKISLDLSDPANAKKIQAEIDAIQNYLNQTALDKYIRLHNIPKEVSMIFIKNEFLFDKYYALNVKKRYASHVISQEGKSVDFMDVKGLDIKRSDISEYTRQVLNESLDMLFKDASNDEIKEYIAKRKEEAKKLILRGDPVIAKSVNFSKPLEEYKNLPQHIKGMTIWNLLVKEDFKHGDKGRLFNLAGIDLSEAPPEIVTNYNDKVLKKFKAKDLNVIVLPQDVDHLPKYLKPDVKKMVQLVVEDKTNLLLEPILTKPAALLW